MKKVLRNTVTALLVLLLSLGCLAPAAGATTTGTIATAEIPVTVYMDGNILPSTDTVTASMERVTSGAPVPDQTTIQIVCRGSEKEGSGTFTIDYSALGVYEYNLTIHGGDYYLAEYGEDVTYRVVVSVTNNEDYSGYDVTVAAHLGDDKRPSIEDTNKYIDPMTLTVVKKWVDQDSSRPSTVTVDLLQDGNVVDGESLVLSASNNWQASWTDLDPRLDWSVRERKVTGYTASYKFDSDDNIWYVTNTGSLLQTGQLNWPIPVLCVAGVAMLALGAFMTLRRRRDENG